MGKYFGTDGFRGEAGVNLTADHAYKVGRFLGWYYNALRERSGNNEPARIVIGKDTRRSSYMFEYSLVAGLTASGADAYLLHVTTTPSVDGYTITNYQGIVFGEVVSGVNMFKDLGAGLRNMFGGRSQGYEEELMRARNEAIAEMQQRAEAMGAHAVVGVDIDYEVLGADNGMLMVTASGTAVQIARTA